MSTPSVSDHLRPTDAATPDGVYRVVGVGDETVTLLRVADADGRRANTGELHTVRHDDLAAFEPAANPDGNRPLGVALVSAPGTTYWSVRTFVGQLARHPVATAGALALLVAGAFGDAFVPLPEVVCTGAALAGGLALAYVGSGRW